MSLLQQSHRGMARGLRRPNVSNDCLRRRGSHRRIHSGWSEDEEENENKESQRRRDTNDGRWWNCGSY